MKTIAKPIKMSLADLQKLKMPTTQDLMQEQPHMLYLTQAARYYTETVAHLLADYTIIVRAGGTEQENYKHSAELRQQALHAITLDVHSLVMPQLQYNAIEIDYAMLASWVYMQPDVIEQFCTAHAIDSIKSAFVDIVARKQFHHDDVPMQLSMKLIDRTIERYDGHIVQMHLPKVYLRFPTINAELSLLQLIGCMLNIESLLLHYCALFNQLGVELVHQRQCEDVSLLWQAQRMLRKTKS